MTKDIFEKFKKYMEQENSIFPQLTDNERKAYMLGSFGKQNFCSNLCGYLNYTEQEQNKIKPMPDHICLKYNKRLKHGIFHPEIMRCDECIRYKVLEWGKVVKND